MPQFPTHSLNASKELRSAGSNCLQLESLDELKAIKSQKAEVMHWMKLAEYFQFYLRPKLQLLRARVIYTACPLLQFPLG